MNSFQKQHIRQQALNFWTGKEFSACCEDSNCEMQTALMKDGSYQVITEHDYEIRIMRSTLTELAEAAAEWLAKVEKGEQPEEPKANWELLLENVTMPEKEDWLEPEEIAFWDEVALLYQEIPTWLIQTLDEAAAANSEEVDVQAVAMQNLMFDMADAINAYNQTLGIDTHLEAVIPESEVDEEIDDILDYYEGLTDEEFAKEVDQLVKDYGLKFGSNPMADQGDFFAGDGTKKFTWDLSALAALKPEPNGDIVLFDNSGQLEVNGNNAIMLGSNNKSQNGWSMAGIDPVAKKEPGYRETCQCETQVLMSQGCRCGGA